MSCTLNRAEALQLYHILEQANKTYLKESRHNAHSNFNILRVLSAFRLLHPDSPTSLYNSIIYITKIYNPQNLEEWQQAIKNLSRPTVPSQKPRNNRTQTSVYIKTYQNSFNKDRINSSHFQSKSYAQIKIPAEGSFSHEASFDDPTNKDISQTNAETGKRYFLTKADSVVDNSKNHYISFEPYHQISGIYPHSYYQKENINSTNIGESRKGESALQYIEAIRKDIGSYSLNKTPADQSFIKKIDSYESPYLISQANLEPMDPEEEAMNERAQEYLKICLKFKAFSSLVANTLAFQKAKEYRLKADMLNRAVLLQRSFICLRENAQVERQLKQKQQEAQSHYLRKVKKYIMGVFKLLYSLRTQKTPVNPKNLNIVSYDFILTLLLSIQEQEEASQGRLFDFDSKISQFISSHQIDKVYLIIKYFGRHSWMTQQAVERLIEQYKQSIAKRAFSILLFQKQQNQQYMRLRQKHLKCDSFEALKQKWRKSRQNKMKVMQAEGKRNKILQRKVMKGLLEIVYSVKLYSKRCEYLQKKYDSKLKSNMLSLWQGATKIKVSKFKALQENVKCSQHPLIDFFRKYYFRRLREEMNELSQNQQTLSVYLGQRRAVYLLRLLKARKARQVHQLEMKSKIKQVCFVTALSKWKDSTRKGKALSCLFKTIKQFFFRTLVAPALQSSIVQFKIVEEAEFTIKRNILTALKANCTEKITFYTQSKAKVQCLLVKASKKMFLKLLDINRNEELHLRLQQEINSKKATLQQYLANCQNLRLFRRMRQAKLDRLQLKDKQLKLTNIQLLTSFNKFIKKAKAISDLNTKLRELNQRIYIHKTSSAIKTLQLQILDLKAMKIQQRRKKQAIQQINKQAVILLRREKCKIIYANKQYERKISAKTIDILKLLVQTRKKVGNFVKEAQKIRAAKICEQKLRWLYLQWKANKSYKRYSKSLFLTKLRQRTRNNLNELNLERLVVGLKVSWFLSNFKALSRAKNSLKTRQAKKGYLAKWIAMNRLKGNYMNSIIAKKYQYMAVKFRALKICQKIFTAWQRKNPKTTYKLKSQVVNIRKGNERLSTDFG